MCTKWLEAAERYLRRCRWWDLALVKVCLCAMGVLIGLAVPGRRKQLTAWVIAGIFAASYAAVMVRFLPVLAESESGGGGLAARNPQKGCVFQE